MRNNWTGLCYKLFSGDYIVHSLCEGTLCANVSITFFVWIKRSFVMTHFCFEVIDLCRVGVVNIYV
jgi:hypothetical protein